jgi:hypothetical protein
MAKIFVAFMFLTLICSVSFAAMPNDLVLYMTLDSSTITGTTVKDLSNYGNNGVIKGAPKVVAGHKGEAMSFNGVVATPDSIEIPTSASLAKTATQITLEAWLNPSKDALMEVISKWDSTLSGMAHCEIQAGGILRFCIRRAEAATEAVIADAKTAAGVITPNKWTHVAETYDGKTARVYVNGVEVLNLAGTGNIRDNAATKYWIGSLYTTDRYFAGLIDDVRIWSRALTADEVKKAMDGSILAVVSSVDKESKLATAWGQIKK